MKILKHTILSFSLLLFSCNSDNDTAISENEIIIPSEITITDAGLFPTKFDFDFNNDRFIVGSIVRSNVGHINIETGVYETFITDNKLASISEVYTDEANNRLFVASGDDGFSANVIDVQSYAYLGVYNLQTGEKITGINLHELHPEGTKVFANAITMDDSGNVYVTDSFSSVIYKINGTTYENSILVDDSRLQATPPVPGMMGIVYVEENLIVSKQDEGKLFKVPLSNPSNITEINIASYLGIKGLEVLENNNIAATIGGGNPDFSGVKELSFNDTWDTATVVSSFDSSPVEKFPLITTLASNGELYLINSYFLKVFSDNLWQNYSIVKVE